MNSTDKGWNAQGCEVEGAWAIGGDPEMRPVEALERYNQCQRVSSVVWIGCDMMCRDCLRWVFAEEGSMQPRDECLVYKDMQICMDEAHKNDMLKDCEFKKECDRSCPGNRALNYASLLVLNPTDEPTELPTFYLVGSGRKVETPFTLLNIIGGVVGFVSTMVVLLCFLYTFPLWVTGIFKAIKVYILKKAMEPPPTEAQPPPILVPKRPYKGKYFNGGKHLVVGWTGAQKTVAPGKRLSLGESVMLRADIPGDTCLKRGEVGVIVVDDHDGQPYQVLGEVSQKSGWYDEQQLVRANLPPDALPNDQRKAIMDASEQADRTKRNWSQTQTADSLISYKKADSSLKYQLNVNSGLDDKPQEFVLKLNNFDMARVDRGKADALGGAATDKDKKNRISHQPPQMKGRRPGTMARSPSANKPMGEQYGGLGLVEQSSTAPPPDTKEEQRIMQLKSPGKQRTYG
jgi:hypothetical protein